MHELDSAINKLTYKLNGLAMRAHRELGCGMLEKVYKEALELELRLAGIPYEREKEFKIVYRGFTLKSKFYADFVVDGRVILEVKAQRGIVGENYQQTINYLAVSKCELGMIYNFGEPTLDIRRVILSDPKS